VKATGDFGDTFDVKALVATRAFLWRENIILTRNAVYTFTHCCIQWLRA
jgi:hypothetical protein